MPAAAPPASAIKSRIRTTRYETALLFAFDMVFGVSVHSSVRPLPRHATGYNEKPRVSELLSSRAAGASSAGGHRRCKPPMIRLQVDAGPSVFPVYPKTLITALASCRAKPVQNFAQGACRSCRKTCRKLSPAEPQPARDLCKSPPGGSQLFKYLKAALQNVEKRDGIEQRSVQNSYPKYPKICARVWDKSREIQEDLAVTWDIFPREANDHFRFCTIRTSSTITTTKGKGLILLRLSLRFGAGQRVRLQAAGLGWPSLRLAWRKSRAGWLLIREVERDLRSRVR